MSPLLLDLIPTHSQSKIKSFGILTVITFNIEVTLERFFFCNVHSFHPPVWCIFQVSMFLIDDILYSSCIVLHISFNCYFLFIIVAIGLLFSLYFLIDLCWYLGKLLISMFLNYLISFLIVIIVLTGFLSCTSYENNGIFPFQCSMTLF